MKLFIALDAPHHWIILGHKNMVKDTGTAMDFDNYRIPKNIEQVVGVARGDAIACHSVLIPGKRKRHVESALPYALEDRLTDDVDDLHFKLLSWQADAPAYAAVVSKQRMSAWVERFQLHGINLDAIIADYFLLPQHPKSDVTIAITKQGDYCIRLGSFQGLSLDNDGFLYWWQTQNGENLKYSVTDLEFAKKLKDLDEDSGEGSALDSHETAVNNRISHWNIGDNFSQWMANSSLPDDFESLSVLDGAYSPTHNKTSGKLIRLAATICVLGVVGYWGMLIYENDTLETRKAQINFEMRELFSQNFPNEPYLDRPRAQLTSLLNNAKSGKISNNGFQIYLNAVSDIAPKNNAVIEEINFRENDMIVLCTVQDLSSLDVISQAFNQLGGIRAELLSSGARNGKVTGRFRLNKRT